MFEDWLESARSKLNEMQLRFAQLVAARVMVEFGLPPVEGLALEPGPLRYLLHGPPGTGKSHVLKLVQELFQLVGLQKGLDWQFLAFQATNAADLGGDTIHHACSFNLSARSFEQAMRPEAAKRMAYWRWLFIDEISLGAQCVAKSIRYNSVLQALFARAWGFVVFL